MSLGLDGMKALEIDIANFQETLKAETKRSQYMINQISVLEGDKKLMDLKIDDLKKEIKTLQLENRKQ